MTTSKASASAVLCRVWARWGCSASMRRTASSGSPVTAGA